MSSNHALAPLFEPRSIAVIGASASPDKAGYAMMQSLQAFPGALFPVNPNASEVFGRAAAPSITAVDGDVDLAVLVIPPAAVPGALRECAAAGVMAAVVCSGGFAESGEAGAAIQDEIVEVLSETGLRLLGPNTSGFMNPPSAVTANFMPAAAGLRPGKVGVVAQSGGVNLALSFLLEAAGVGLRLGVGLGNAIDVGFAEVIDYLADDPETTAIGIHVEGVSDGRALVAAIKRASAIKPVVAFKVGRNDVGAFAQSHTGALTGSYELTRQALRHAGAVIVDSPTRLVDSLQALSEVRLPAHPDPGVGIVTGQAGPGLIIADALASYGVRVPQLSEASVHDLGLLLPPLTFQQNPVDTGRPGPSFPDVLATVADDPAIELLAIYALDEPGALDPADAIASIATPTLFASGGPSDVMEGRRAALSAGGTPLFTSPDRLAAGVAALVADAQGRTASGRDVAATTDARASAPLPHGGALDEDEAKDVFAALGLPMPRRAIAGTRAEASEALRTLTTPVVVKVLDASILHKSDVGGVHVGVDGDERLATALSAIDAIPGDPSGRRYLLEEQASAGTELIVGGIRDEAFGPTVLLSLGGVGVELGAEPILRLAPIDHRAAVDAVRELPAAVLDGFRGAASVDVDALAEVIVAVGDLLAAQPTITEIDLNPVRATAAGLRVLDALIVIDSEH